MKQTINKLEETAPLPPGTEAIFNVTCKDVVLGRGNGTQNHCGNVTYRKLVYLNKELYATSSKFEKLKISKALVAAIRKFGGRFLQAEGDKKEHFEIGDKRAWDKTSQALREGQTEVRARLEQEAENALDGTNKVAEYKKVISEQAFFAYACKILQSLYNPTSGSISCGPNCPHAKRRALFHKGDATSFQHALHYQQRNLYGAQRIFDHHHHMPQDQILYMPPPQNNSTLNYNSMELASAHGNYARVVPSMPVTHLYADSVPPIGIHGGNLNFLEPLPYNMNHHQPQETEHNHSHAVAKPHNEESSARSSTWEPLDFAPKEDLINQDSLHSYDTEALRKLLLEDVDIESDRVERQLDEMIRRKSRGLIRIDMFDAFEDLVFEEDSTGCAKFPEPQVANASDRTMSGLTDRGESLMNMSLLTIEDSRDGGSFLKAIDEKSPSDDKRPSRVGLAVQNVSAMSMDLGSISDFNSDPSLTESHLSMSRKMGFPIRRTVLKNFQSGVSNVIPTQFVMTQTRGKISTLTLSEASALQNEVTGKVPQIDVQEGNSLREDRISAITEASALKCDLEYSELVENVAAPLDITQPEIEEESSSVHHPSPVGFAPDNVSTMSLDMGSFRDILYDLTVNESSEEGKSNTL
ncbi:hypothetical protein ACHAW6_011127 [Cyclotella cf. meneghiniana]